MATKTEGMDKLKDVSQELLHNLGNKAFDTANDKLSGLTGRLTDIGDGGPVRKAVVKAGEAKLQGDSPVLGGVKGAVSGIKDKITGGKKGSGKGTAKKPVNIYEIVDVGVPVKVAYNQWTEYEAFPKFTRKVEKASAQGDKSPETSWGAKIFLSHREWKATTVEQVPDERIVWVAEGAKGYPNGSVTFSEIGPSMTRVVLVIEYHPKGLFEKTGNIWRAQGRRVRSDFKQFPRHVMTRTVLHADEVDGWRGTIHEKEIVETHEDAFAREQEEQEREEQEQAESEESESDYDEAEGDDGSEGEDEEDLDEYEDEDEEEEEDQGEEEEDEEELAEEPRKRRRRRAS